MNETQQKDPLSQLIQEDQFVGWTYKIDYEQVLVFTMMLGRHGPGAFRTIVFCWPRR